MLILQKYVDCIKQLYKLRPENLDFKNHLEEARIQINAQIENKTKGRRSTPSSFSPFSFRCDHIQWHAQILKHLFRQFWQMYIMTQSISFTLKISSTSVPEHPVILFYITG